jgi:hypothetical protein
MRNTPEIPSLQEAKDSKLKNIVSDGVNAQPITSKYFSYLYMVLPEYIDTYVDNIIEKSEEDYTGDYDFIPTFNFGKYSQAQSDINADIVKSYTGLQELYDGDELWVKQAVMYNACFVRNNEMRFFRKRSILINSYGVVYYESIRTTKTTTWNSTTEEYETVETVAEFSGEGTNAPRARTLRSKRVSENIQKEEFYVSSDSVSTCKLKLELTETGKLWVDEVKDITALTTQNYEFGEPNEEFTVYDTGVTLLEDGVFVDRHVPIDFDPPLETTGVYNRVNFQEDVETAWIFKEFQKYQDLLDVLNT